MSARAQEVRRQTELPRSAWAESGKVYEYRKRHDDLVEQGESICPNRVARLAQIAGVKAQIGHKRRPGSYGGKPSVVVDIEPVNVCRWFRHRFEKPEACVSREPARP